VGFGLRGLLGGHGALVIAVGQRRKTQPVGITFKKMPKQKCIYFIFILVSL